MEEKILEGESRLRLRTLLLPILCHQKINLFIDSLYLGLKAMFNQIILEGNYFSTFETGANLKPWDVINSDMKRLIEPFHFGVFFDQAIRVIPASRLADIHRLRPKIEEHYQDELRDILETKKRKDIFKERSDITRKLEGGVIINMSDKINLSLHQLIGEVMI